MPWHRRSDPLRVVSQMQAHRFQRCNAGETPADRSTPFAHGALMLAWKLPADARAMLLEVAQEWGSTEVAVPYAGDFGVERSLRGLPLRFHSADVEVTSAGLGSAWLDLPFPIRVAADYAEAWGWLTPYLDTASRAAATLLLSSSMALGIDQPRNLYYARLHRTYRAQWERLHQDTLARVDAARPALASYTVGDPLAWLDTLPDLPVIYGGGEPTTLRGVRDLFEWDEDQPHKRDLDALLAAITSRDRWAIALPATAELPGLTGYCRTTNMATPVRVYASGGPARTRRPVQLVDDFLIPRLAGDERPGDPIALQRLSVREFAGLRSRYLNPLIPPASPRLCVAVLAAGKLVGTYAVNEADGTKRPDTASVPEPYAYLLSDFPVAPGVKRLAKVVLLAALSRESQLLIEQSLGHRTRALFTTAFSQHPVSQKYRGVFDLVSRKDREPGSSAPYALNYCARLGQWPLAEVLGRWER